MRTMLKAVLGLGLVALVSSPAFAQGGRGFGMGGGGGYAMLIGNEGVQKELKLDDTQVEKAKEFAEKAREKMTEARSKLEGLEGEERRTKMQEIQKEMNEEAMKSFGDFLKPEQIKRLKQISYHQRGHHGASRSRNRQKAKPDRRPEDGNSLDRPRNRRARWRELRQQFQDDREGAMKKMAELRKETLEKAVAKLNDEQQKTWKELIGAPFEVRFQPRGQ